MGEFDTKDITVEQLCKVINMLHPCMDDYLYVYDLLNDYYYISPEAIKHFSLPAVEFHDVIANHAKFVYPQDIAMLQNDLQEVLDGKKDFHNLQYRWLSKKGEPIWINCRGYVVRREDGTPEYMLGCINEIGARQKADNVSGLLGMSSLRSFLEEHASKKINEGYLMRLGLDDFKEINEKLGSDYGDMVLRKTAECIDSCILPGQTLYRAGSDEFLVLDIMGRSIQEAVEQYQRVRQAIDSFVKDNHYEAVYTVSAGILGGPEFTGYNFSDIMRYSEFSLNEAKRRGRNRAYVLEIQDYERFMRKKSLIKLLRNSINHDFEGFEVYLQPLVHAKTQTLYGAEALMRYHTQEYGMVSPVEFIPLLEETGLIIPAGKWMLHHALELCHDIQMKVPDFRISINISYIQVLKSNIISEILQAIEQHQVDPSKVIIELTESGLLLTDSRIAKLWNRLKEKGIQLALDDFGTGYSNFHYLNDLHPEIIKIDRSFTVKAVENEYEYKLLSLMSDMVHGMDVKVCVEGIENEKELGKMLKVSPNYCQGYYFGKPCNYQDFRSSFIDV